MISIRDISKSYGSLKVLHGISLDINRGEVLSVVGPSGAGKTTLLQIVGTLERPDSGSVFFDGEDVVCMKESRLAAFRCRSIGFVFQFHQLLPEFTMQENVAIPAMIAGMSHHKAMERAAELIKYLGLYDRRNHKPSALSGGECQRAAVARALVNSPAVVLADEPSGSLDSRNRDELHRLFFQLRRDMGQTFVIVTHDEYLASTCDRIVYMSDGRIQNIEQRINDTTV
ncbi:ABC transporter ATP-binding protein [Muribaculum sp.]|uniref:ABC transporter ATP-binding protein n=1 Tax=Muribaculum sp. TaxID=1918611 RepID=UPI0023C589C0|nr:ABC transporter ATP-binding protein [Muribaculum sp.]MDE5704616.1 ABC transporter ATP-binding protein [Muribaculum sp.]